MKENVHSNIDDKNSEISGKFASGLKLRKKEMHLLIGGICGLLIIGGVVALVLHFTLWNSGEPTKLDPESIALAFFESLRNQDAEAYIDCHDPDVIKEAMAASPDVNENNLVEYWNNMLELIQVEYSDLEFETQSRGEDRTQVAAVNGHLRIDFPGFAYEPDLNVAPIKFEMVWKDGRWYIENDPLADLDDKFVYGE